MRRWCALGVLVVLLAILAAVSLSRRVGVRSGWPTSVTSGAARGFNLLLITLDTTRADRLGCYGHGAAETPTLDALAANGVRFADAVTVAPITLPSHATILTGLDPPNHGARHNGEFHLGPEHETLAETLREQGYDTAAFVSAFVLDARFGLNQGFDHYDDNVAPLASGQAGEFTHPIHERDAGRVTDAALHWLNGRERERPFFCWVHFFDPHAPYQPPASYAGRFRDRPYDGEIAYMDSQIGRLLAGFRDRADWEQTITIVVADHGESLGEHGESTHAKLIYEATMHVPLIIACPKLIRGAYVVDGVVVSVADIAPTVHDLFGVDVSRRLDGRSLLSAHTDRDRVVYMETLAPYMDNGWSPLFGLRRHKDKYILAPREEYYDLGVDPNERDNLFGRVTGDALAARESLAARLGAVRAASPDLQAVLATARPLDPEAIKRLESLGYVGSIMPPDDASELPDPKDLMPVQEMIDRAGGLARAGRFAEALELLDRSAVQSPKDPTLLLTIGKTYLFMDRIDDAESVFRRLLAIRPSARVCVLLAQIMLADGRLDAAAEILDQAEALEPNHGGIHLARGDWFALKARPDDAIHSYEQARAVDPYRASAEAQARIDQLREFMRRANPP